MEFENISARLRSEQLGSKSIQPNAAQIVNSIFICLSPDTNMFLDGINLKSQLIFLMLYYAASITYSTLGNRFRKQDFQGLAEKDMDFRIRLAKFVLVLFESKINILVNFADLIKAPIQLL